MRTSVNFVSKPGTLMSGWAPRRDEKAPVSMGILDANRVYDVCWQEQLPHFLRGAASRPGKPPALWVRGLSRHAASRATVAKLQTYWGCKVVDSPLSSCQGPPFKDKGQSFIDCPPRPRGRGAAGHRVGPPLPQRV